ncbi:MAG: zinc-dependent metalloprotease [Bacteroidota bacterium]|nr:zinc-dependent metalloprotease [Bacteroidota bacterium]
MRLLFMLLLLPSFLGAQKLASIDEKTKEAKKHTGFINYYWDESTGKFLLEVDKLDHEFLYVSSLPAGLGSNDIGLDRGLLGDEKIVKFTKTGRKILLVQPNYRYRAVTEDAAEKRAVEQSFAQSVLWGFNIEAETGNKYLIDATDFFIRDAMRAAQRLKTAKQGNYVFDKNRSAFYLPQTKNFPLNSEIETTITLVNTDGEIGNFVQSVTPSPEAISLRIHHSFVQLPEHGYEPRVFDPRSSFIPISFYDYSTPVSEPIEKFYIVRHRLQKKDPAAPVSEAVKPITYYLDNGTPEPIRSALLEGARWWNQAFEAAGYKDAFQVKVLPEDADPMDVRYNVINWVHRSTRGWSYGASVVDPRTGEIIKGHVTLGSLRVRQDYLIAQGLLAPFENDSVASNDPMLQMALNRLKQLSAHEVGHTIGLMHNYAASVSGRASVMDYPHPAVTLVNNKIDLSDAYDLKIGEWDKVAIRWGYQDYPDGANEKEALNKILTDAYAKGLQFISDRDARAPGGLHPQAHLWDNGTNASDELTSVMKIRAKALENFGENNIRKGMPMAILEDVLVPVYFFHRYQLEAASKIVGGLFYNYALRGDGQVITKSVPKAEQLKALEAITEAIKPANLVLSQKILDIIPPRPAGYSFSRELFVRRTGLALDALTPAESLTDFVFSFLLQTERMNRMMQYKQQHNGLGLDEMLTSLISKTWRASRETGIKKLIQLQNEQILLTYLLAASIDENAAYTTRALIHAKLNELKTHIEKQKNSGDETYKGHLLLALERMKAPDKAKPTVHKPLPPGAPIGCDMD